MLGPAACKVDAEVPGSFQVQSAGKSAPNVAGNVGLEDGSEGAWKIWGSNCQQKRP